MTSTSTSTESPTTGGGSPRFAVVGDNTIDRYLGDEGRVLVGGNALNVAVQLSLHGDTVRYFGAVADDPDGRLIRRALERGGVDSADVVDLLGVSAVTEIRTLANGDRVFDREDFGVTAEYYPSADQVRQIAAADWVHIGMLPQASRLRAAIRAANPATVISQDLAVSTGVDALDVGFSSGALLGDESPVERITAQHAAGVSIAIVTLGEDGSIGSENGHEAIQQPAAPAIVVDTTGAGDSLIAGFIHNRARGMSVADSLSAGASWAAVTCGHVGGWPQT